MYQIFFKSDIQASNSFFPKHILYF